MQDFDSRAQKYCQPRDLLPDGCHMDRLACLLFVAALQVRVNGLEVDASELRAMCGYVMQVADEAGTWRSSAMTVSI